MVSRLKSGLTWRLVWKHGSRVVHARASGTADDPPLEAGCQHGDPAQEGNLCELSDVQATGVTGTRLC